MKTFIANCQKKAGMLIDVSVLETSSFRVLFIHLSSSSSFLHEFEFRVWTSVELVKVRYLIVLGEPWSTDIVT